MSFVRINRPQYGHVQGKRRVRSRKVSAPKREWVSTINDLSIHKASPEELSRRHDIHRSQNHAAAQFELRDRALVRRNRRSQPSTASALDQARCRIIREVFSEQLQLHDVLTRSDRAMAVVKDLFGDAPRRQTGFPSVTVAPDCGSDSELPVVQRPDPPTQLSLLSQSMMDSQALNELEEEEEEQSDEEQDALLRHKGRLCRGQQQQQQQQSLPQTPCNTRDVGGVAALNATVAVQRLKSRHEQGDSGESTTLVTRVLNPGPAHKQPGTKNKSSKTSRWRSAEVSGLDSSGLSTLTGNQSSLELLQSMLGQVETELDSLGSPGPLTESQGPLPQGHGLKGFSVALVSTLGRLASLLKQREEEAQKEVLARRHLEDEVKEQRSLIDALTAESLALREESVALQTRMQEHIAELEQRFDTIVLALGGLGMLGEQNDAEPHEDAGPTAGEVCASQPEGDPEEQRPLSPALLLSPPRQRDSQPASAGACARSLHYKLPMATRDHLGSWDDLDASSSPSSFASLPHPSPLLVEPSQDAVLEQIAELTRQNAAIRAQLGQHRLSPAGAPASRMQIAEAPTPTGGAAQRPTTPSAPQASASAVQSMEERLLELNRQSAAARTKLLELIEQQRLNNSLKASPSVSPIPALSAAGRLSPEAGVPERGSSALTSARSTEEVSPQSLGGRENRSRGGQVAKPKGEAWFALSAHVR